MVIKEMDYNSITYLNYLEGDQVINFNNIL